MMKICILMSVLIFLGTSEAQTNGTTTTTAEQEGSADIVTSPTPDPCLSDPCKNGGKCTSDGDEITCDCPTDYAGDKCETYIGCSEEKFLVYQNTSRNGIVCGEDDIISSNNNTVNNVTFTTTSTGQWATSQENCDSSCVLPQGSDTPLAIAECKEGDFIVSYTDCSATADTLLDEEDLLPYAIAATSTPQDTTAEDVSFSVDVTTSFTTGATTIQQSDADAVLEVYDNLFNPNNAASLTKDQSTEVLDSIDQLSEKVDLMPFTRDASEFYERIDDYIALAVAKVDKNAAYFGADRDFTEDATLANAGLKLTNEEPTSNPYIGATPTEENSTISFRVYSSYDSLFNNTAGLLLIQNTVLSGYGSAAFSFNFIDTLSGTSSTCQRWNRIASEWQIAANCEAKTQQTGYISCVCTQDGDYIITRVTPNPDSGLSGGAIAGIVIGSIAAAALIGGGIYYFAFYAKKKKNSVNVSKDELQLKDVEENESDKTRGD